MRPLGIPAFLIGVVVSILFFKLYGVISRPSVPAPVAMIVGQFAPGVEIGTKVSEAHHGIAAMTYVPHLGFVGIPNAHTPNTPTGRAVNFSQVRLLIDEHSRMLPNPNPAKTRFEAVEVVTGDAAANDDIGTAIMAVMRRLPREGCLRTPDEGRFRQVLLWTTPNDRGGIAMINDFFVGVPSPTHGPYMTNVVAFVGKFEGGRTLRGDYTDATCTQISTPQ